MAVGWTQQHKSFCLRRTAPPDCQKGEARQEPPWQREWQRSREARQKQRAQRTSPGHTHHQHHQHKEREPETVHRADVDRHAPCHAGKDEQRRAENQDQQELQEPSASTRAPPPANSPTRRNPCQHHCHHLSNGKLDGESEDEFRPAPMRRTFSFPLIKSKTIGQHTQQGNDHLHAQENQDRHIFYWDEGRSLLWLGVFDGHSGSAAADFLSYRLLPNISRLLPSARPFPEDVLTYAIRNGIIETENQFKAENQPDGEWLLVANVGDSRAVLGSCMLGSTRHLVARTLTNDHNATNEAEAKLARFRFLFNNGMLPATANPADFTEGELIEKVKELMEGSDIIENGRLLTVQLTRSIGDFGLKKHCYGVVSNEPEFTSINLCDDDRLLILASDGVWATVTAEEAVNMVLERIINLAPYVDLIGPAEYLVQEAVSKGSGDDQTALVLDLKKYRKGLIKSHTHSSNQLSPLELAVKKGLFLSARQSRLNTNMYGSATRSFGAKMALLHAKRTFIGSSEPNLFEIDAKRAQMLASSAHRPVNKIQSASPPLRSSVLGLFDSAAIEASKAREEEKKKKRGRYLGRSYH